MEAQRGKGVCVAATIMFLVLAAVVVLAAAPDVSIGAEVGWFQQASGTTDELVDISAVDAGTAWAVGTGWSGAESHATILRTVDGGTTWSSQISDRHMKLSAVSAVSADTAWIAGGTPGMISKTTDGGATWIAQDIAATISITWLCAVDEDTVWAASASYGGYIYKSSDGGATWALQNIGSYNYIESFCAVDADIAWAIAGSPASYSTLVTTDGGATWNSQPGANWLDAVSALDADTAWGTMYSAVMKTGDGGANWESQTANSYFNDICALDPSTAWAAGISGRIGKCTDGTNWFSQDSGTANTLNGIEAVDADAAWAVGAGGIILKTEDGGGDRQAPGITSITPEAAMASQLVKIEGSHFGYEQGSSFVSFGTEQSTQYTYWTDTSIYCKVPPVAAGETGVSVTADGMTSNTLPFAVLAPTENGWNIQDSGTLGTLYGVAAVDASTAWAVGDYGTILKTGDGGATWVSQDSGTSAKLLGVAAVDADKAFAVGWENVSGGGMNAVFLKTADGGANWSSLPIDKALSDSLSCVGAADANNVWIGGSASAKPVLLKTSDGGTSWDVQNMGIEQHYYMPDSISVTDADNAWVSGGGANMDFTFGYIVHTSDGGATWTVQHFGYVFWSDISATDTQTVFAAGSIYMYSPPTYDNHCYKSTDGGATWTDLPLPFTSYLGEVSAVDADTAWVSKKGGGNIYKTIDGGSTWSHQTSILETIYDIAAVDADNAWAVGAAGIILHTSGGGLRPAPTITSVEPNQGSQLSIWFGITDLEGTGFEAGAKVRLEKGSAIIDGFNVNVVSDSQITCTVGLFGVEPGAYDVVVVNPDGQEARLEGGFTVVSQCGQGAGASLLVFGIAMGLLSLAGAGVFRKRRNTQ